MLIFIKTLTGLVWKIIVNQDSTIDSVKKLIKEKHKIEKED